MFLKYFVTIFACSTLAISALASDRFTKTIEESIAEEQSLFKLNYVTQRCAGLLGAFAPRLRTRNDHPEAKQMNIMADELEAKVPNFAMYSMLITQKMNGDRELDMETQLLTPIKNMQQVYFQMMERNITLDGNALDDDLVADLTFCNQLYEEIK